MDDIRNYFGEHVGFYFAFGAFAIKGSFVVSVIGLSAKACELLTEQSWSQTGRVSYAVFLAAVIALWTTIFIKIWMRRQSVLANHWGMDTQDKSSVKEQIDKHFHGTISPHTSNANLHVRTPPESAMYFRFFISPFCTALFLVPVCMSLYGNLTLHEQGWHTTIVSIALTFQIKLIDWLWGFLSRRLTIKEQHIFHRDSARSNAKKAFGVRFVNTFGQFFYIAFFEKPIAGCVGEGCYPVLRRKVMEVFVFYTWFGAIDAIRSGLHAYFTVRKHLVATANPTSSQSNDSPSYWTGGVARFRSFSKGEVDIVKKSSEAFNHAAVQVGLTAYTGHDLEDDFLEILFPLLFIMLFGIAFPSVMVLAPVGFIINLRCDAWKLCNARQRPYPQVDEGIGRWRTTLLRSMGYVSVFTNWGFITFLSGLFEDQSRLAQVVIFFVGQQTVFLLKFMIDFFVNDSDPSVLEECQCQDDQRNTLTELQPGTLKLQPIDSDELDIEIQPTLSISRGNNRRTSQFNDACFAPARLDVAVDSD